MKNKEIGAFRIHIFIQLILVYKRLYVNRNCKIQHNSVGLRNVFLKKIR